MQAASPLASIALHCVSVYILGMHRCTVAVLFRGRLERLTTNLISLPSSPLISLFFFFFRENRKGRNRKRVEPCLGFHAILHGASGTNISSFAYRARDTTICIPLCLFFSFLLSALALPPHSHPPRDKKDP